MTELEYSIEVLCTDYTLIELNRQRSRLKKGVLHKGADLIDNVSLGVLNKAISYYNEEKYVSIRSEMIENRVKYGVN